MRRFPTPHPRQHRIFAASVLLFTLATSLFGLELKNASSSLVCDPATLEFVLASGTNRDVLSSKQTDLGEAENINQQSNSASWFLPKQKITVQTFLQTNGVLIHLEAEQPGEFKFPILPEQPSTKGWILPMFEGVYAPTGDAQWIHFLTNSGAMSATAEFTMPFLAVDAGNRTVTCILTNPFNNEISFNHTAEGGLQATVTHSFTRNHKVKEFAVFFQLGGPSPIEPAKLYRDWLIHHNDFVTLQEKIQRTPEAAKLPGAAHVYLWGDQLLAIDDVKDWKAFAQEILVQMADEKDSPVKTIWQHLNAESRSAITNITKTQWPDRYSKSIIVAELNQQLLQPDFFHAERWKGNPLDESTKKLSDADRASLSQAELCRLNCGALAAVFPGQFKPVESWGGGLSPKMISALRKAGFDRLWLGAPDWQAFLNRPETVKAARDNGYLIGTYDSYNAIHRPKEPETWSTAQFDEALYETGAIVKADGTKRRGFKKKGYSLSPTAARPYVEKRVSGLMAQFHANSWFIDCDGFGEYFDDYSEAHPATQETDMHARISRMAWIRDQFHMVIGSEGCSSGVASTIHFAHGVMTPVIGWGDPDLTDKKSPYYLGAYYPPEAPRCFFLQAPTKPQYKYIYFDPRFRLPLFETAFHDSVVATHHWSFPSLKTSDCAKTVELLELLYQVPPLYHLNLEELAKRKDAIKRHYDFFSPLHRKTALLPLTDFKWLTDDHQVQSATFGEMITVLANFSTNNFAAGIVQVPAGSIVVRDDKSQQTYTPSLQ